MKKFLILLLLLLAAPAWADEKRIKCKEVSITADGQTTPVDVTSLNYKYFYVDYTYVAGTGTITFQTSGPTGSFKGQGDRTGDSANYVLPGFARYRFSMTGCAGCNILAAVCGPVD